MNNKFNNKNKNKNKNNFKKVMNKSNNFKNNMNMRMILRKYNVLKRDKKIWRDVVYMGIFLRFVKKTINNKNKNKNKTNNNHNRNHNLYDKIDILKKVCCMTTTIFWDN
jgi:hypothetical protein